MNESLTFLQHIFTSSKSRGGYMTFQVSEEITNTLKDDLQSIGKIDYNILTYIDIPLVGNQLFHNKIDGQDVFGSAQYLGNDIHSNDNRPGNYITHSLVQIAQQSIINPVPLFEKFDWKKSIKEEDSNTTPIFIQRANFQKVDPLESPSVEDYFDFLRTDPPKLDAFAKVLDFLVAGFIFDEKISKNRIIIIDESKNLKNWAFSLLLCFPENLANKLTFVVNLKNRVLPQMTHLVFSETIALVPDHIVKESLVIDLKKITQEYHAKGIYTKKTIDAIKKGQIKKWLNDLYLYFQIFPRDSFWNELREGPIFYDFLEQKEIHSAEQFDQYLKIQLGEGLSRQQLDFLSERIFSYVYIEKNDNDRALELMLFLVNRDATPETICWVLSSFYKGNKPFSEATLVLFLKAIITKLQSPIGIFDLKRFIKDNFPNSLHSSIFSEVDNILLSELFMRRHDRFWLDDTSLLNKLGSEFLQIDKDIDEKIEFWQVLQQNIEKLKTDSINWGTLVEILDEEKLAYFGESLLLTKKIKEVIPSVSIDEVFSEKNKSLAERCYEILGNRETSDDFYPKLPKLELIREVNKLLKNELSDDEKLEVIESLSPTSKEKVLSSRVY